MELIFKAVFIKDFKITVLLKTGKDESTWNCNNLFTVFKLLFVPFDVLTFLFNQLSLLFLFLLLNLYDSSLFLFFSFFSFFFESLILQLFLVFYLNFFFLINQSKVEHVLALVYQSLNLLFLFNLKLVLQELLLFDSVFKYNFLFV